LRLLAVEPWISGAWAGCRLLFPGFGGMDLTSLPLATIMERSRIERRAARPCAAQQGEGTMGLRQQLMDDLKEAMREKDEARKRAIRSVLAALKQAETELDASGERTSLDDEGILVLIAKQARERQESIDAFQSGGRDDLVAREQGDLDVLQAYLPQQLSREEIEAEARQVIADVGAGGPQDMGKVMKPLLARLRGRADGRLANQIVREILAG